MMEQLQNHIKNFIENTIRTIPDFPKEGIMFKDITTLLSNKDALELTSYMLHKPFADVEVDYVIGLESRGFLFGTNLAQDLNAGFIPVRKPGKLPSETITATYTLEYGEDSIEMHKDALYKGARVIIHDDLIATGGTAAAASELVQKLGATVIGYSFIIELSELKGSSKLALNDQTIYDALVSI